MTAGLEARLARLEAESAVLDPPPEARHVLRDPVLAYSDRFLDAITELPAYVVTGDKGRGVESLQPAEAGIPIERVLAILGNDVDRPGLNPASGGHLGYIPGGGLFASALADYLTDVTNRYAGVFFSSPGAVRIEHQVVRWTADLVGFPASAGGTLASGGSIANLICLAAARDAHRIRPRDVERAVVYLSSQTHHCITKNLRLLGLGECVLRYLPLDERSRIRPEALAEQVESDRRRGLSPWLLVASAGSTDTGAIDPLATLGSLARDHRLWYHVDAAYGGYFMLVPSARDRFRGIELADSTVLDPHKTLFLPYGSGIALVRDQATLAQAFRSDAPYLQDTLTERDEVSPADLSPELTRPFRGLRLWLPLLVHGLAPFRASLEEKLLLTEWLYTELVRRDWEVGPEPDLSVIIYRRVPTGWDLERVNRLNQRIVDLVKQDGRVYVSSTLIDGRYLIRYAGVTHRTHLSTVRLLLDQLEQAAQAAERELVAGVGEPEVRSTV